MTSRTFPGSDAISNNYTSISTRSKTSTSADFNENIWHAMEYDDVGRILRHMYLETQSFESRKFTYNGLGYVVGDTSYTWRGTQDCDVDWDDGYFCEEQTGYWDPNGPFDEVHQYDDVGNRTSQGGDYDTVTTNRIEAFDGCDYDTDDDGNVYQRSNCGSGAPNATFYWTSDNRLWKIVVTGGYTVELKYDANGRLARKYRNGNLHRIFIWNGSNLFAELDPLGNKILEYSYYPGYDNLHGVIDGSGESYFAHTDGMGNVIALTDDNEDVVEGYSYMDIWGGQYAYGAITSCSDEECNRAKYKGALYLGDEAGLYYMRNRWYEPHTGRFLSEDPIGLEGGINLYAYAGADPINYRDPTGRYCEYVDREDMKGNKYEVFVCSELTGGDLLAIRWYLTGAGEGVYADFENAGWTSALPNPAFPYGSSFASEGYTEWIGSALDGLERCGCFADRWYPHLRRSETSRAPSECRFTWIPGASGSWHTHWHPLSDYVQLPGRSEVWNPKPDVVFSEGAIFVTQFGQIHTYFYPW